MIKKALLVCEDNTGIIDFAQFLIKSGWSIFSNGKTAELFKENNIPFKTESAFNLSSHPIHDCSALMQKILQTRIIDSTSPFENSDDENNFFIVCLNFDPIVAHFNPILKSGVPSSSLYSFTASLIRNCCTNYPNVLILTDPKDYKEALIEIRTEDIQPAFRTYLTGKALNLVSAYDAANAIAILKNNPFNTSSFLNYLTLPYKKKLELHHALNPQQEAVVYQLGGDEGSLSGFKKIQGKELTFKCSIDTSFAWDQVSALYDNLKNQTSVKSLTSEGYPYTTQFTPIKGTVFSVLVKYKKVVGAALDSNVLDSFKKTVSPDPDSNNKASLACSAVIDADSAREMLNYNLEGIIAPGFTEEAKDILSHIPETRLIIANLPASKSMGGTIIDGGVISFTPDKNLYEKWVIPTKNRPNQKQVDQIALGTLIASTASSYASVLIKDNSVVGVGAGFTSRSKSLENVCYEAKQVFKSHPTDDNKIADVLVCDTSIGLTEAVIEMIERGVSAILQTGGNPQDQEFINYCDEHNVAMVFTGMTHYTY
ncbi:MAG: hypothetical protein HUK25_01795 [Treponema sp.]|nr:hypothetical protein [Treponema sp.]